MLLVDTSIWIELLGGRISGIGPDELVLFVTCGPVVQEVFQGLKPGRQSDEFRESFLALPSLCDPLPRSIHVKAAEIYREGRKRGYTIRSSVDCLIAAIAIETTTALWHRDRDYDIISRYTPLSAITQSPFLPR